MNNHALRPLYVVLALVGLIIAARFFVVPESFGVHERGYMYGWHRKANEEEWKEFKVKYKTAAYCKDCHSGEYDTLSGSPHFMINCENCHGPAVDHPEKPQKLSINKERTLCLRCHALLSYPQSGRAGIKGIDPEAHNAGIECVKCHNPHGATKPT